MPLIDHKFLKLRDSTELHTHVNESGKQTWLVVTHGLGEHLRRHNYIVDLFKQDFNILQYDLRGHGLSHGKRAYIEDFSTYIEDLKEVVTFLLKTYNMKRFVLFGHSMGSLITASYLQSINQNSLYPDGVFLSAPVISSPGLLGGLFKWMPFRLSDGIRNLSYSLPLKGLVNLKYLSHNNKVYQDYINDELICMKIHSRLAFNIVHHAKEVFSRPLRSSVPLFVAVGSGDKILNVEDIKNYFELVEKGAQLKIIRGGYHELHNELSRYRDQYFKFLTESVQTLRI